MNVSPDSSRGLEDAAAVSFRRRVGGRSVATLLVAGLVLVVALRVSFAMWGIAHASDRLQGWDNASRGFTGVRMADALRHHDVVRFVALVDERGPWPPLYPVLEAPLFVMFGDDYAVPEEAMAIVYFGCIVAAAACGMALGGPIGIVVGGLTAAWMAASPMYQVFGTQIMLEMPGALLLLVAIAFYIRYRRFGRFHDAILVCVASLLTFFLKYNYAVLWLVPMAVNECTATKGSRDAVREGFIWLMRTWRRPFWLGVSLYSLGLIALASNHRRVIAVFGHEFRLPGLRVPLMLLVATIAMRALLRPRAHLA
jgi:hypothetical protein